MNKIYYAHPINIYGTKQELRDIETISELFKGFEIYNPSEDENAKSGYKLLGMKYFLSQVDQCNVLIFRALIGGHIPPGVKSEINRAVENGCYIVELPSFYNRDISVDDTRTYLKEVGYR